MIVHLLRSSVMMEANRTINSEHDALSNERKIPHTQTVVTSISVLSSG